MIRPVSRARPVVARGQSFSHLVGNFAPTQGRLFSLRRFRLSGRAVRTRAIEGKAFMRVLLRDTDTGLYFREPRAWTTETEKALSFKHSAEAMNLARAECVENAEVVLTFEESSYSVALPLP